MTAAGRPPVDPSLIPQLAWTMRWRDRVRSEQMVRDFLDAGHADVPRHLIALAQRTLAWHHGYCGRFDEAISGAREAIVLFGECRLIEPRGCAHVTLAAGHLGLAQFDQCRRNLTRGLMMLGGDHNIPCRAEFYGALAQTLWVTGSPDEAEAQTRDAIASAVGEQSALAHHDHARLLFLAGRHDEAAAHNDIALHLAEEMEVAALLPAIRELQGACILERGDAEAALNILRDGLAQADSDRNLRQRCHIVMEMAKCYDALGALAPAVDLAREALSLVRQLDYRLYGPGPARYLAELYERSGAMHDAVSAYKTALSFRPLPPV